MPKYPLTERERKILKKYVSAWRSVKNKPYLRQIRKRIKKLNLKVLQGDVDLIKKARELEEENKS